MKSAQQNMLNIFLVSRSPVKIAYLNTSVGISSSISYSSNLKIYLV
jgi:hypothetical protein